MINHRINLHRRKNLVTYLSRMNNVVFSGFLNLEASFFKKTDLLSLLYSTHTTFFFKLRRSGVPDSFNSLASLISSNCAAASSDNLTYDCLEESTPKFRDFPPKTWNKIIGMDKAMPTPPTTKAFSVAKPTIPSTNPFASKEEAPAALDWPRASSYVSALAKSELARKTEEIRAVNLVWVCLKSRSWHDLGFDWQFCCLSVLVWDEESGAMHATLRTCIALKSDDLKLQREVRGDWD